MTEAHLKVAIIGKAPSSISLAPYNDESWEIWTLSDLPFTKEVPRWTRHFELHDPRVIINRGAGQYWKWLTEQPTNDKPIYMREMVPAIQAGVLFPWETIIAKYGGYFNNTVSWLIAFAIQSGVKELGVFGVDMAQSQEYLAQRPSCEYYLGMAEGMGIKVTIPGASDLLKCRRLYGIEDEGLYAEKFRARNTELRTKLKQIEDKRDNAALEAAFFQGCVDSQEYYAQWLDKD
jgi:hypothetical protein